MLTFGAVQQFCVNKKVLLGCSISLSIYYWRSVFSPTKSLGKGSIFKRIFRYAMIGEHGS